MTDLSKLIERLKAATGPDRDIDLALWNAVNKHPSEWHPSFPAQSVVTYKKYGEGAVGNPVYELDAFTASADASLALVERLLPGWRYDLHSPRMGQVFEAVLIDSDKASRTIKVGHAQTAPLAILSALLMALEGGSGK